MHSGPKLNGTMIAKVHIHANSCMVLNSTGTPGQVPPSHSRFSFAATIPTSNHCFRPWDGLEPAATP